MPVILGNAGDRLVFAIDDDIHGSEPWVTDGTENGTALLADITPGPASTTFKAGVSLGDRVVFGADHGNFGLEPWVSDGTAAGTHLIADIAPGRDSSIQTQSNLIAMKGNVFFVASQRPQLEILHPPDFARVHPNLRTTAERTFGELKTTNPQHGIVLTDDYNPIEFYDAANRESWRRQMALSMKSL